MCGGECLSVWDVVLTLADVTMADEDTNSIQTDDASRAIKCNNKCPSDILSRFYFMEVFGKFSIQDFLEFCAGNNGQFQSLPSPYIIFWPYHTKSTISFKIPKTVVQRSNSEGEGENVKSNEVRKTLLWKRWFI